MDTAKPFIDLYDQRRPRLNAIVQEPGTTANEVKKLHNDTTEKNLTGGALGIALGAAAVGAIVFGEREKFQKLALGLTATLASNVIICAVFKTISDANSEMLAREREMMGPVNKLCEEFMNIIEQQKNTLMEIKNVLEEINERLIALKIAAGPQADKTLSEIDSYFHLMQQMDELTEHDRAKLFYSQLARQSEKTCEELTKMRNDLEDFAHQH